MSPRTRRAAFLLSLLLTARATAGQAPSPTGRYIVTTTPVLLFDSGPKLCVGVDPTDPTGVWWWEAGRSGCSSRSTGPDVFAAWNGTVTTTNQAAIAVRFRLGMHVGEPLDVQLTMRDGKVFASGSGVPGTSADLGVQTMRSDDLVLPFISLTHSGAAQDAINSRQAWGSVVNGLRTAIALVKPGAVPARGAQFDAMFQNVGDRDIMLNLGVAGMGETRFLLPVRLALTDAQGSVHDLQLPGSPSPAVAGRLDDLVVRVPAGATHVVRLNLEKFGIVEGLGDGRFRVTMSFEGVGRQLLHSQPPATDVRFWIGRLQSGALDFNVVR